MNVFKKTTSTVSVGERKSEENTGSSENATALMPSRFHNARLVQNYHLVWLDTNIDETNDDCRISITQLGQIVNNVTTFIDVDECIDFVTDIGEKAFMIISGEHNHTIMTTVQDIPQMNCVYIFCRTKSYHEKWAKEWSKVAGVHTDSEGDHTHHRVRPRIFPTISYFLPRKVRRQHHRAETCR